MFTTGLMKLHQAGKVTNNKGVYDGVSITTFAGGTRELYDWLDGNHEVRFLPVDLVNSPEHDLQEPPDGLDQRRPGRRPRRPGGGRHAGRRAVLRHRRPRGLRGGIGPGARGPLADLPEVVDRGGRRSACSRIAGQFAAGTIITTPRHQLDVVITEYGVAELRGRTVRERARALAAIAHPDFRDQLLAEAEVWPPA